MKTPDEIKKGLQCCMGEFACSECPYSNDGCGDDEEVKDALAYIQRLEAAQPKWISVEERLPEDDVEVLVYIASKKENVDSVIAITHYTHSMYGYNIEGWCSPWQYCFWDREVTYWMPLPEPPKEDA